MSIDSACSSSLVAVHVAAREINARAATRALAAGVSLTLSPEKTAAFEVTGEPGHAGLITNVHPSHSQHMLSGELQRLIQRSDGELLALHRNKATILSVVLQMKIDYCDGSFTRSSICFLGDF